MTGKSIADKYLELYNKDELLISELVRQRMQLEYYLKGEGITFESYSRDLIAKDNTNRDYDTFFNKISQMFNVRIYDDHCIIEDIRSNEKITVMLKGDERVYRRFVARMIRIHRVSTAGT